MRIYWRMIRISSGVDEKIIKQAKEAADNHPKGNLHDLPFTESNFEWVLLYEHAQIGQITAGAMKNMKRKDLYYLAGLTYPHPSLTQPRTRMEEKHRFFDNSEQRWERVTKLQGNAARAKNELARRNFIWASTFTIIAAIGAVYIGFLLKG